ncbi:MAG TPA: APC family permease [Candidatus Saccharimonadales bacterium]|nr:APC family permease [Candidatus Saccharimonadales bacterium]
MALKRKTKGSAATLDRGALSWQAVAFQGLATIGPAFAVLAILQFTASFVGLSVPLMLIAGVIIIFAEIAIVSRMAARWPSAGGWFTWISSALSPRAGFIGGWIWSIWIPPAAMLTVAYLASAVLQPAVAAYYNVNIAWQWWVLAIMVPVVICAYEGIRSSIKVLVWTTSAEMIIFLLLGFSGILHPGAGGLSTQPFNVSHLHAAPMLFLGLVFSLFSFTGWESIGPLAEESANPRKNVPRSMYAAVAVYFVFLLIACYGIMAGWGFNNIDSFVKSAQFPGTVLAQQLWGPLWIFVLLALLNSGFAVALGAFHGGSRTWYGMARAGLLPSWLNKISPRKKVPITALHLMVVLSAITFLIAWKGGVASVYLTWVLMITLILIIMYSMANIGVISQFFRMTKGFRNPILCFILPAAVTIWLVIVAYKNVVPFPAWPLRWGLILLGVWLVVGFLWLVALQSRKSSGWQKKAKQAFDNKE